MTPSPVFSPSDLDFLCINTIRTLSIDAVDKANSGHPGLPLGATPMAYVLWQYHLKHAPTNPGWADRDRFVLSAGHGSMLLYSLMHLTGYSDVTLDEIKNFRQWGSKTPGHPESFVTRGVECTTGPLGQGSANAVGMAVAERALAHRFNKPGFELVNHYTYAIVSDGDLMEGVAAEAGALAGHLKLGKLIYLYDANDVTLDGPAHLTFTEDIAKRYESYGWQVLRVENGDTDLKALDAAIRAAKSEASKPSIIIIKTTIGYGSPNRQGTSESHGKPLGTDENKLTKQTLGWKSTEPFFIPSEAGARLGEAKARGERLTREWEDLFEQYGGKYPELAQEWRVAHGEGGRHLPAGWDSTLPAFKTGEKVATRVASGKVIQALAPKIPWLIGGDADLGSSTNTLIKDGGSFEGMKGSGRNIHYGVREHAMGSIANGMSYHGGVRPFVATFFVFSDYMRPPVRLAAMNHLPVVYVWTHDSILLGEDGPTHQPIEHLAALRAIPNLTVIRPADANETVEAWRDAMNRTTGPTALVLTRQNIATLEQTQQRPPVDRGAYVISDSQGEPRAIVIATGSEVSVAIKAQEMLKAEGIRCRVVSMPSWENFERQDASYRDAVLPPAIKARVAVEAASSFGWAKWVGIDGRVVGIERFGASAPAEVLAQKYGITAEAVRDSVMSLVR